MKCPLCGLKTEAPRSMPYPAGTHRFRVCACGFRGTTEERWLKSTFHCAGTVPAHVPAPARTVPALEGGKGVLSLSAISSTLSNPELSSVVSKQETSIKKRGRGDAAAYDDGFELFWSKCINAGRGKGNKYPASKAYAKFNLDPALTSSTWNAWMETPQWSGGHNQDVSSWLNARGFEREPSEVELRPRGQLPEKFQQSRDAWTTVLAERKAGK